MNRRAALNTASDLLQKLRREQERLEAEVSSDGLFNFVVTAHSLNDWIKNDPSVPRAAKCAAKTHKEDDLLRVCRDIANGYKHFELNKHSDQRAITAAAISKSGYGIGRYAKGGYGLGEEKIVLKLRNGSDYDLLDFCERVVERWSIFFENHTI